VIEKFKSFCSGVKTKKKTLKIIIKIKSRYEKLVSFTIVKHL